MRELGTLVKKTAENRAENGEVKLELTNATSAKFLKTGPGTPGVLEGVCGVCGVCCQCHFERNFLKKRIQEKTDASSSQLRWRRV